MNLRRRSSWLIPVFALATLPACATTTRHVRSEPVPAEALTDERTIRLRCEDPDGVIAGRVLCILRDIPRAPDLRP